MIDNLFAFDVNWHKFHLTNNTKDKIFCIFKKNCQNCNFLARPSFYPSAPHPSRCGGMHTNNNISKEST